MKTLGNGKPPQARIELPEGVETYGYAGQKLNIWEFQ